MTPSARSLCIATLAACALATTCSGCKAAATACRGASCVDGGVPMGAPGELVVSPATAMITVKDSSVTQQFYAIVDGQDVTREVEWTVSDKNVGQIAKGLFTSFYPLPHAGPVTITATQQSIGKMGSAALSIGYVTPDVVERGAPQDAAASFGGVPSQVQADTPHFVYPLDGVLLARNINQINFQWTASLTQKIFRLHVVGPDIDASFYVGAAACSDDQNVQRCAYQPADDAWQTIVVTASRSAPAAVAALTVTLSSTSAMRAPVSDSVGLTINLSPEDVRGGLYYFSPSINGLKRLPFGSSQATDFVKNGSGFACAGCHALSRDGKKVAATFYGGDGAGGVVAGDDGKKFLVRPDAGGGGAVKRWNFATFNPDATLLLTSWAGVLTLRDGTTGAKKFDVPVGTTGGKAVMPEWSPDGLSVAFVQLPTEGKLGKDFVNSNLVAGDWDCGDTGNIAVMKFAAGSFQPASVIVPSSMDVEYHYFPSWSPDSQWILFVTASYPGSSPTAGANLFGYVGAPAPRGYVMTYDQDTARLRLVQASGGSPTDLVNATHALRKTTSWPRFAPFIQASGSLVFFTFSAKFDYGFIVTDGKTPQLWMAAIDLKKASPEFGGNDPSYPPFWLPFQNPLEKNHSGIWTQEITCAMADDCGSEFSCQQGECVPNNPQ